MQRAIALKFYERFLNNVSRLFPVTSYALGILKKRNLKSPQDLFELLRSLCSLGSHRFRSALKGGKSNISPKFQR